MKDGLSQTSVSSILQDSRGIMWFGTEDGLNSYDGYQFTHFKHKSYDPASISSSFITKILEDTNHNLWIGTHNGINKLDLNTKQIIRYPLNKEQKAGVPGGNVFDMILGPQGQLIIANYHAILRFDPKSAKYKVYQNQKGQPQILGQLNNTLLVYNNEVWIGGEKGIAILNIEQEAIRPLKGKLGEAVNDFAVIKLRLDRDQNIWISTENGLLKYNPDDESIINYSLPIPHEYNRYGIKEILQDKNGYFWAGSFKNVPLVLAPGADIFYPLDISNKIEEFYAVTSLFQDNAGIIWIGSFNGIYKFDPNRWKFQHFKESRTDSEVNIDIRAIRAFTAINKDKVLVASSGTGLHEFNPTTKKLRNVQPYFERLDADFDQNIKTVLSDSKGFLWIGMWHNGLYQLDTTTGQIKHILPDPKNPQGISSRWIRSIVESPDGDIWIGSSGGLNRYSHVDNRFQWYQASDDSLGLTDSGIQVLFVDSQGYLWAGTTNGGLNRYDFSTKSFKKYYYDPSDSTGISYNYITSFAESPAGTLWIGTYGGGLNKLDVKSGKFTHFNTSSGLPNDVIYGLLTDDRGNLWISSNSGITKFDFDLNSFRTFDVEDGLQSNEFNSGAYFRSSTGQLYFGGINGFNAFYPDSITNNTHPPKMLFTDFQINNKSVTPESGSTLNNPIAITSEIVLDHRQSVFSFEFVALNYTDPGKNQYAYQLVGFDKDWQYLGTRNFITFTNIDPGKYTLRVKGSNNDGTWNEQGLTMGITVLSPWWQTSWAYLIYALLVLVALYIWRNQVVTSTRLKGQYELERVKLEKIKELDRVKSTFFENISHEFRTPLTLIQGPLESIYKKGVPKELLAPYRVMINNSRRLQELIGQLMDLSKLEAGKMRLQSSYQDLVPVVRSTFEMFQTQSIDHPIAMRLTLACESLWLYFEKDKLQKILYNLISNAYKFTAKGEIHIALSREATYALIEVSDTGPGIPQHLQDKIFDRFYQSSSGETTEHGTGIGLALTKELVDLHNGSISLKSTPEQGTSFKVQLPLSNPEVAQPFTKKSVLQNQRVEMPLPKVQTNEWATNEVEDSTFKVLIVEDQVELRGFLRNILAELYAVSTAQDGEEGWQLALENLPDLIISDIRMPKMDGFTLCKKLKNDRRTSHIPVVLLTANSSKPNRLKGLEIGADDYLIKPFDEDELIVLLNNRLQQREQLRKQFSNAVYLEPTKLALTSIDEIFLRQALEVMEQNMDNPEFKVESFLKEMGMSRTQLHRKLRALTNQSTTEFMRSIRIKRAAQLLKENHGNVSEVSDAVGFNRVSTFIKEFKKTHQITPLQYRKAQFLEKQK